MFIKSNRSLFFSNFVMVIITSFLTSSFPKPINPLPKTTSDELVTITGTVTGNQYNNLLTGTLVKVLDTEGNELDADITNINGEYVLSYMKTGIGQNQVKETNLKIYPNLYRNNTNLEINLPNPDNYVLKVTSADGKTKHAQNILLPEGNNKLNLEGGSKGFHLITLTNGEDVYTYKAVQTQNTGMPFFAEVESTGPLLKTTSLTTDSVYVQFIKPGYDTLDVKLASETQTYNAIMQQLKDTINFTLKPFLETGLPVTTINPTFYVSIDWEDGTTTTHTGDVMNISKELYKHPDGSFGTALIYNDTTDLDEDGYWVQNWSLGRRPNQVTNIPNWYQNESSLLIPEFKTTMTLDSLDGQIIHHYTIKNKAETQEGVYENLDSEFTNLLMIMSGSGLTSMFIDLASYGIDSLHLVKFNFDLTTGNPMEQWQLDRVSTTLDAMLQTKYLPNGDTLLPPHIVYSIDSFDDPRWQEVVQRGFENSIYLSFHQGLPGNGRFWTSNYSYNGHLILDYAFAKFNANNSNGTILAEIVSAVTGVEEGTGSLGAYVSTLDGLPTEYCKSISTMPVLFNLGTGYSKSGNAQPKLNDYETLRSITVHNPDGTTTQINDIISTYDFFKEVQED